MAKRKIAYKPEKIWLSTGWHKIHKRTGRIIYPQKEANAIRKKMGSKVRFKKVSGGYIGYDV